MNTLLLQLAQVSNGDRAGFVLFGLGLIIFIAAVALCHYLLDYVSRIFEAACDWLEHRLAKRKVRRRSFAYIKQYARQQGTQNKQLRRGEAIKATPKKSPNVSPYKLRCPVNAQEALRRSCFNQAESDTEISNSHNTRGSRRPRYLKGCGRE